MPLNCTSLPRRIGSPFKHRFIAELGVLFSPLLTNTIQQSDRVIPILNCALL
jgi:hypothetical protein